jgi:CspA family cold shock protein
MEGTVKWFTEEKGFGFIVITGRPNDLFFHISEYRSEQKIKSGDKVRFDIGIGKQSKEAAMNIYFVARGNPIECVRNTVSPHKQYYGKPTKTKDLSAEGRRFGLLGTGGPIDRILGGWFGSMFDGKEVTSTCLKCGGTGHVTAIDENFIGFQCSNCRSFWRKRNKENLSMTDVIR